ncbi:hypothetical protein PspLS_02642 [Pyricularia sp. CBS 133598]|nr:hypothetical protein PspLS_02642 [Pyricularia sp. CBS 133598]
MNPAMHTSSLPYNPPHITRQLPRLGTMKTSRLLTPLRPLTPSVLPTCGDGRDADQVQTGATLEGRWPALLAQTHAAILMETNNDRDANGHLSQG